MLQVQLLNVSNTKRQILGGCRGCDRHVAFWPVVGPGGVRISPFSNSLSNIRAEVFTGDGLYKRRPPGSATREVFGKCNIRTIVSDAVILAHWFVFSTFFCISLIDARFKLDFVECVV